MCGIAGIYRLPGAEPIAPGLIDRMLAQLRHRGPDEYGIYCDPAMHMGSARLSIIDLATGQQPIGSEDGSVWIVYNGEIFNYVELMADLKRRGHVFQTHSDTETIVHLYEEYGPRCIERLNGQFALALWDARRRQLLLARDRVGIRPLFYTQTPGALLFGSEIKALVAHPALRPRLDPQSIAQVFTCWAPLSPRTIFEGITEVPPGGMLLVNETGQHVSRYWTLRYPEEGGGTTPDLNETLEEFDALLADSVRLRLRADVPVGAYLSGGIDSCTTVDTILRQTQSDLRTFGITFAEAAFDESSYQRLAVEHFGTQHSAITCADADLEQAFEAVLWHAEVPILRTAPIPMFLLSGVVHDQGIKVVVTGEGADEFLGGYNIFRETLVRSFWARQPESALRPQLLTRLYPYLRQSGNARTSGLRLFFGSHLTDTADPVYSHLLRWSNTGRARQAFSPALNDAIGDYDAVEDIREQVAAALAGRSALSRAQYLEATIFMSSYLLSSQGDRMAMAHSVEGRYPFLDHRLIEFTTRLPTQYKIRGLREKYLLKQLMRDRLPGAIVARSKQPYRAPIASLFARPNLAPALADLLSPERLAAYGWFSPGAVGGLLHKAQSGRPLSEAEQMTLVGVLSLQGVQHLFVEDFTAHMERRPLDALYARPGKRVSVLGEGTAHRIFMGY